MGSEISSRENVVSGSKVSAVKLKLRFPVRPSLPVGKFPLSTGCYALLYVVTSDRKLLFLNRK